jgi:hypothetical protein
VGNLEHGQYTPNPGAPSIADQLAKFWVVRRKLSGAPGMLHSLGMLAEPVQANSQIVLRDGLCRIEDNGLPQDLCRGCAIPKPTSHLAGGSQRMGVVRTHGERPLVEGPNKVRELDTDIAKD